MNCTAGSVADVIGVDVERLVGFAAITAGVVSRSRVVNDLLVAGFVAGAASTMRIGSSLAAPLRVENVEVLPSGDRAGLATAGVLVGEVAGISVRIAPPGSVTDGGVVVGEVGDVGMAAGGW